MPRSYDSYDSYDDDSYGSASDDDAGWSRRSSRRPSDRGASRSSSGRSSRGHERYDDQYSDSPNGPAGSYDGDDRYGSRQHRDDGRDGRSSHRSSRSGGSERPARDERNDGYDDYDDYGRQARRRSHDDGYDRRGGSGSSGSSGGSPSRSARSGRSGELSQGNQGRSQSGGNGGGNSGRSRSGSPDSSWDRPGTIRRADTGADGSYGGYAPPSQSRRSPSRGSGSGGPGGYDAYGDGYGVAGPPSRSAYGSPGLSGQYGQRAPASRQRQMAPGMGGMGNRPGAPGMMGQPALGQWGPASQMRGPDMAGMGNRPGMGGAPSTPPKKSHRKLWVVLSLVAVLVLLTAGGGGFVIYQLAVPATAAATFCADLKTANYSGAYGFFDQTMQQQLTSSQFSQLATTLITAEGSIQSCAAATTPNSYSYHLGGSIATAVMVITRANFGTSQGYQGAIHLKKVGGSWEIDALDTGLFGVNLNALLVVNSYCAALQGQNYQAAYATLGSAFSKTKASDYTQTAQLQDQVDGKVNYCQVSGVATGNNDNTTNLTLTLKRDTLGQRQDTLSLDVESNAWKISAIGQQLQGTDLGAYRVMLRFCSDLSSANYNDIFGLLSDHFKGSATEAEIAALFAGQVYLPSPVNGYVRYAGCTPDPTTYKVSGSSASVTADTHLIDLTLGTSATGPVLWKLVQVGSAWQVDDFTVAKTQ